MAAISRSFACLTPMYDVERFGIINTGNPKHADIFVVTGSVNERNKYVIKNIYDQMPDPESRCRDWRLAPLRAESSASATMSRAEST